MKIYEVTALPVRKKTNEGPLRGIAAKMGSDTAATGIAIDKDVNGMLKQFKAFYKNTNQGQPTVDLVAKFLGKAGFPVKSPQDVMKYLKAAGSRTTGAKIKRGLSKMMPTGGKSVAAPRENYVREELVKGQSYQASDGETYKWMGQQFLNVKTRRVAQRAVAQELKSQNAGQPAAPSAAPAPGGQPAAPAANPKKRVLSGGEVKSLFTYLAKKGFSKNGSNVTKSNFGFSPGQKASSGNVATGSQGANLQSALDQVKDAGYRVTKPSR